MTSPKMLGAFANYDEWNGPRSIATTPEARVTANSVQVVPVADGGCQLELHAGGQDIEIEVSPDGTISGIYMYRAAREK